MNQPWPEVYRGVLIAAKTRRRLEALADRAISRVFRDIRKSRTRIDPFNRRLRFRTIVVKM